jgi:hypothetical protein
VIEHLDAGQATPASDVEPLWDGDAGTLREPSRRVLAALIKGPYVSADRHGELWRALLADTEALRSRLADLFLELVVDPDLGIAFVRAAQTSDGTAPQVVRTLPLTFIDTILLLHLRGELVRAAGAGRVIVGKDDVYDSLQSYRTVSSTDEAGFTKRINASWTKFEKQNLIIRTSTEGRFEISPVLRLVFGTDEIAAVRAEYVRLRDRAEQAATADLPYGRDDADVNADEDDQ